MAKRADELKSDEKSETNPAEAEAKVRKALAEAIKAEEELADYRSEAAAAARAAEHAKVAAEAEQARRTAEVIVDPALVRRQKEAELRQTATEAETAAVASRRSRVEALVPDLAGVAASELTVGADRPLLSAGIARHALGQAAEKVAKAVEAKIAGKTVRILVTSDDDLATPDGIHLEVQSGLEQLTTAADQLIAKLGQQERITGSSLVGAEVIGGAIANVIPGLLSLFAAKRATSSHALELDAGAAIADVAGRLVGEQRTILIDDFRRVPDGAVVRAEKTLRERRSQLTLHKVNLEATRSATQIQLTQATATAARLQKQFDELEQPDDTSDDLARRLGDALREVARLSTEFEEASGRVGIIDELVTGIDEVVTAIHVVPEGQRRSLFVTAALFEQLHSNDGAFTHVLYVSAATGSIDQATDNKPLWFRDKFSVLGTANITYLLIDASSVVVSAGVKTGAAGADGKIGSSLAVTAVQVEDWTG
ncbi:MAG: hypothetical protein CL424_16960 [Acidimicrobiaceae bacterium]|nr:hypothetical protein [Acidimicrobiaceae bacterium]